MNEIETLSEANDHAWKVAKNLQADIDVMRSALEDVADAEYGTDTPKLRARAAEALAQVAWNRENT